VTARASRTLHFGSPCARAGRRPRAQSQDGRPRASAIIKALTRLMNQGIRIDSLVLCTTPRERRRRSTALIPHRATAIGPGGAGSSPTSGPASPSRNVCIPPPPSPSSVDRFSFANGRRVDGQDLRSSTYFPFSRSWLTWPSRRRGGAAAAAARCGPLRAQRRHRRVQRGAGRGRELQASLLIAVVRTTVDTEAFSATARDEGNAGIASGRFGLRAHGRELPWMRRE
jgi:hypothetical protein